MDTFNKTRLLLARQRRGMKQVELARQTGIHPRSIVEYEHGRTVPYDSSLDAIARVLRFPKSFFFQPSIEAPTPVAASFRALKAMTAGQRDSALAAGALAVELTKWIEGRFQLLPPDVPDMRSMCSEPESAAAALRERWGLGSKPIKNMVHLLESRGVRVFSLAEESRELDAFSVWTEGQPFVFLNTMKSVEHSRFDAAHELGHLVLHRHSGPRGRETEHQADSFASAFLMPRESVLAHAPRFPTLDGMIQIKKVWAVSAAAVIYRLHKVDSRCMTDWQYRNLCIQLSQRGRAIEPEALTQRETSQVLNKVFAALRQEGTSKADVAKELHLHLSDLEALVFGLVLLSVSGAGSQSGEPPSEPTPEPPRGPAQLRLVVSNK